MTYKEANQIFKTFWEDLKKNPRKTIPIFLAFILLWILSTVVKSYFESIGNQLAQLKPQKQNERSEPAIESKLGFHAERNSSIGNNNLNVQGDNNQVRIETPAQKEPSLPTAAIDFKNEPPFVKRQVSVEDSLSRYYYRVKIQNQSYEILNIMGWKIVDLQRVEGDSFKPWGNIDSASLVWDTRTAIPPKDYVFVSFARIFPPEHQRKTDTELSGVITIPHLRFTISPWYAVMTSHVEPGTYRFRLIASFDKAPPAEAEFELQWAGNQESIYSMVQEIKIRKL